jgi:hypothetical protein
VALNYAPVVAGILLDLGDASFAAGQVEAAEDAWERGALIDPALAASRTGSREARREMALERLKSEIASERRAHRAEGAVGVLLAASDAVREWLSGLVVGRTLRQRLGSAAVLAFLVLAVRALFVFTPHYVANLKLRDDVARACRTASKDDTLVHERVMSAVHEHGRDAWVKPEAVQIEMNGRLRRIEIRYAVPIDILPGWSHPVRFAIRVEEPVLVAPDPTFI